MKDRAIYEQHKKIRATVDDLCVGDIFYFRGYPTSYVFMGTFSYMGVSYIIYRTTGKPYIVEYEEVKNKILFIGR